MHKFEKIWLLIGGATLVIFLALIGVSAFAMGHTPPSDHSIVNPAKVDKTEPFDQPGLRKIDDREYEVIITAQSFAFNPGEIEIPAGATVHFKVTSKDVVHGFEIPGTNVNMMITPGHVNTITHTFNKPGSYLILCNEYCGTGHQAMHANLEVK